MVPRREARALASVGLEDRAAHRPSELSGGQQQRVATLARCSRAPATLFADEPTGALDTTTPARRSRSCVTCTTRRSSWSPTTRVAAAHADRVLFLADGPIAGEPRGDPDRRSGRGHDDEAGAVTLGLAFATLRDRWLSLAGAFVALALGAALAIGAGAVLVAAEDAVDSGPARYSAAPIIVTAPLGSAEEPYQHRAAVPASLVARIEGLPQVRPVVRDRAVAVRLDGAAVTARPWSARLGTRLRSGRAPAAPDEVAVGPRRCAAGLVAR